MGKTKEEDKGIEAKLVYENLKEFCERAFRYEFREFVDNRGVRKYKIYDRGRELRIGYKNLNALLINYNFINNTKLRNGIKRKGVICAIIEGR